MGRDRSDEVSLSHYTASDAVVPTNGRYLPLSQPV